MQYSKIKVICSFLAASLVAFVFASIFHTQFVLHELNFGKDEDTTFFSGAGLQSFDKFYPYFTS